MRISMLEDCSEPAGSRGPGLQRRFTGAAHSIGPAGTECFSLDDIDNLAGHCAPTADSALSAAVLTAAFCEESASLAGQECAHAAQDSRSFCCIVYSYVGAIQSPSFPYRLYTSVQSHSGLRLR